jgi:hypothetical protein
MASTNKKLVLSLSDYVFTKAKEMVLQKWINFGVAVAHSNLDMACAAESVASKTPSSCCMEFKWKIKSMLEKP